MASFNAIFFSERIQLVTLRVYSNARFHQSSNTHYKLAKTAENSLAYYCLLDVDLSVYLKLYNVHIYTLRDMLSKRSINFVE